VEPVVVRASVLEQRRREGHPFFSNVLEGALRLA
jgi:hypothetical protein